MSTSYHKPVSVECSYDFGEGKWYFERLGRRESMAMVERSTRSVRFEDSLKFYKSPLGLNS